MAQSVEENTVMRPCRKCGRDIAMVRNEAGKWMPLDTVAPTYRIVDGVATRTPDVFVSHFATCPDAAHFSHRNKEVR